MQVVVPNTVRQAMHQLLHQAMDTALLSMLNPNHNAVLASKDLLDLLDHLVMMVKMVVTEIRVMMEKLDVTVALSHPMDFSLNPA